jgi:hypothetical protein
MGLLEWQGRPPAFSRQPEEGAVQLVQQDALPLAIVSISQPAEIKWPLQL